MIAVSTDYLTKVESTTQRWIPSATIDFSDFNLDNSIQPTVNDRDITSDDAQLSDGKEHPSYRWWYWDSFQWGDHLRSEASTLNEKGALSQSISDDNGDFFEYIGAISGLSAVAGLSAIASSAVTYPRFCITFSPRTVESLKAVFESELGQWATDFDIIVTDTSGTEHTTAVTGNTSFRYTVTITAVPNAVSVCVVVKSWSEANSKVKVMETFTSVQRAYSGSDIISFTVNEETES